jgi:soluble lytic murein transglycosylase
VALLAGLTGVILFGGRWLILRLYPLEYQAQVVARSAEYHVDRNLVWAIIRVESGFKPGATSVQGARGLMQIMPETGEWIARQMGLPYNPQMLYDPDYNIRVGTWYLSELQTEFGGDTVLALAAYNGGRTNVRQWLNERQWTGENHTLEQIPFKETRLYVGKVLRDQDRYRVLYGANSPLGKGISHAGTLAP